MPEETSPVPLDEVLYERFKELGAMKGYEYLDGDKNAREAQKRLFLSGEVQNPQLDYPKIDTQLLESREKGLLALKTDVLSGETNETVKQVYRWKINEKIAEIRMLQAAAERDMRRFKKYSEFVYGTPSKDVFGYTINSIRSVAILATGNEDLSIQAAAAELLDMLPNELP